MSLPAAQHSGDAPALRASGGISGPAAASAAAPGPQLGYQPHEEQRQHRPCQRVGVEAHREAGGGGGSAGRPHPLKLDFVACQAVS